MWLIEGFKCVWLWLKILTKLFSQKVSSKRIIKTHYSCMVSKWCKSQVLKSMLLPAHSIFGGFGVKCMKMKRLNLTMLSRVIVCSGLIYSSLCKIICQNFKIGIIYNLHLHFVRLEKMRTSINLSDNFIFYFLSPT